MTNKICFGYKMPHPPARLLTNHTRREREGELNQIQSWMLFGSLYLWDHFRINLDSRSPQEMLIMLSGWIPKLQILHASFIRCNDVKLGLPVDNHLVFYRSFTSQLHIPTSCWLFSSSVGWLYLELKREFCSILPLTLKNSKNRR